MNPKDVFLSVLTDGECSKVPFLPRDLTLGMDELNVTTSEVFGDEYNSELSAECVLALQKRLGHDVTVGCIFSYGLDGIGGKMSHSQYGIPFMSEYAFADPDSLDKYEPSDVIGKLQKGMRKSCEIVKEKRPDLALAVNVPGPMTMAGFARGVEPLMMDLVSDSDFAERLLKFSKEMVSEEIKYISEDIADAVFFASATDNPDMVGIDEYVEYSVKHVKSLVSECHNMNLPTVYHPHGVFSTDDRRDILLASLETGTDGFQFSEGNEPEDMLETCRGKCCILGGVNAYSTLLLGPDERIVRDTEKYLDTFRNERYIMTCSCSVNRGLPLNNLDVMARTVHSFNEGTL